MVTRLSHPEVIKGRWVGAESDWYNILFQNIDGELTFTTILYINTNSQSPNDHLGWPVDTLWLITNSKQVVNISKYYRTTCDWDYTNEESRMKFLVLQVVLLVVASIAVAAPVGNENPSQPATSNDNPKQPSPPPVPPSSQTPTKVRPSLKILPVDKGVTTPKRRRLPVIAPLTKIHDDPPPGAPPSPPAASWTGN
jgi:hypothetical protein